MKKMKYFLTLISSIFTLVVSGQQILISEDFSNPTDSVTLSGWSNVNLNNNRQLFWFGYNKRNYAINSPMSGNIALFDNNEWLFDAQLMDVVLESPTFDASGTGTITLTFDHYFRAGGTGNAYSVEVYNGTVWDTITWADTSTSPNPPSGTYTTTSESHDITALTGGSSNAKIRFRYYAPVFTGVYWLIDNIEVQKSSCPPPSSLAASNITTASADISWTAGGASDFNLQYGPLGFSLGSGTAINTSTASATLSGLSPNSKYEFYVRDSCGLGMVSNWVGPYSFTTLCTPFSAPYSESFDNGVVQPQIPGCWSSLVESSGFASYASTFGVGSNFVSGPNAIVMYHGPGSSSSDFIGAISPEFSDLATNLNRVRFQAKTSDGSSIIVGTMSDPTDSSTFVVADIIPAGYINYAQVMVDLDNVPVGHKHVAFIHGNETSGYVYFDDVIYEAIPCQATAGIGSFTTVCGNDSAVNLKNYLQGHSSGGTFKDTDNSGALFDSIFDASLVSPGRNYKFTYLISQAGCPDDSSLVTVNVEAPTNAGKDVMDTSCALNNVNLNNYLDINAQIGGQWVDVDATGFLSGSIFDASQVIANNVYHFDYVVSGIACESDTAHVNLLITDCNTGLYELQTNYINIYPNPLSNILNIERNSAYTGDFKIQLTTVTGQVLINTTLGRGKKQSLDISHLAQGVYLLTMTKENGAHQVYQIMKK